jgi:hypothetical protein
MYLTDNQMLDKSRSLLVIFWDCERGRWYIHLIYAHIG